MAGSQGSSFIPKQPARGKVRTRGVRKVYVLAYVSLVLFFGVLIASAGTYFYKLSVETQLEAKQQELADLQDQFSQADLARVQALETQLEAARTLLDRHISVLSLLRTLEETVIDPIVISEFSVIRDEANVINISTTGETDSFNQVLFQRAVLADNPIFTDAALVNLEATESEVDELAVSLGAVPELLVTFEFQQTGGPDLIPYDPSQAVSIVQPPSATSPTSSATRAENDAGSNEDSL